MMFGYGANPIFFNKKKNKDWTSRTLANPNLIFPLPPPNPRLSGRHMCITSKSDEKNYLYVQNTEAH